MANELAGSVRRSVAFVAEEVIRSCVPLGSTYSLTKPYLIR